MERNNKQPQVMTKYARKQIQMQTSSNYINYARWNNSQSLKVNLFLTSRLLIGRWKLGKIAASGDLHLLFVLSERKKQVKKNHQHSTSKIKCHHHCKYTCSITLQFKKGKKNGVLVASMDIIYNIWAMLSSGADVLHRRQCDTICGPTWGPTNHEWGAG